MEKYHEIANELNLTPEQRQMYFELGAAVNSAHRVKLGYAVHPNYSHGIALGALTAANWKMATAKAILTATKAW